MNTQIETTQQLDLSADQLRALHDIEVMLIGGGEVSGNGF
jgi:hypothetical protein